MRRNTRSQAVASVRYQANLASAIHRLPNEVIARILVIGCPLPYHKGSDVDASPLKYQVLVTSVCTLWRQIAHHSLSLWTSVVVRPPRSKKSLRLHQNLLSAALARSGTLELDISINVPDRSWDALAYYDVLAPHLSRAHTLDVDIWNRHANLIPVSSIPSLNKLRRFYAKGSICHIPVMFPLTAQHPPLETFYYDMPDSLLCMSSVPTAELRVFSFRCLGSDIEPNELVKLVENCKLQTLEIDVWNWEPEEILSSPTLAHLDISICTFARSSTSCVIGQLPNLRHLRLTVANVRNGGNEVMWPPLPCLKSLNLAIDDMSGQCGPYFKNVLQGAPQLVALQVNDTETLGVVHLFGAQWGKGGTESVSGKSLRLIRVLIEMPLSKERYDELSDLARILHGRRPHIRTEWYTRQFSLTPEEEWIPLVLDGVEATHLVGWREEPSPPLSRCADKIIGGDGI
jgi:hypothetical protein